MATRRRSGWVERPTDRRVTLPPDWWRRRARQLRNDNHQCQHVRYDTGRICGAPATDVDHVDDRMNHDRLQSLCDYHHKQKTGAQGGNAAAARRRKKESRRHPGIR